MPPQQGQNLLDFGDGLFDFRTHIATHQCLMVHVDDGTRRINPPVPNDWLELVPIFADRGGSC
jgi:hypothetical protein